MIIDHQKYRHVTILSNELFTILWCGKAIPLPEQFLEVYWIYIYLCHLSLLHRKLWLSILADAILGAGLALLIIPVYPDIYGIAQ